MRKTLILGIVALAILPLLPRQIALWAGERKASEIVGSDTDRSDRSQPVIKVARWISAKYDSGYQDAYPAFFRFIPYLS